jgi:hypothetical protein
MMNLFSLLQNNTLIPILLSVLKENVGLMNYCTLCVGVPGFHF